MVEKTEKTKKPTRNLKKFLRLSFFKNLKGKNILLVILLIIFIVLIGLLKNQLVVATVNGKQINRNKRFSSGAEFGSVIISSKFFKRTIKKTDKNPAYFEKNGKSKRHKSTRPRS